MKSGAVARSLMVKELRVLLPTWAAALVAIAAAFLNPDSWMLVGGLLGYGVGALVLGAQSIGHEYAYRTVGLLLVQPVARRQMFLTKVAVLTALLLVLGAAGWYAPFNTEHLQRLSGWRHPAVVLIPVVLALCVAPWLTMACRSALAGVVFAGSMPGMVMVAGELAGIARFGIGHPNVEPFRAHFWLWGMALLSVAGAVLSWRGFKRLEAIDGAGSALSMPRWLNPRERPPKRHPVWLLVWKELHLQQMTFVIVLLYAIGWSALSLLKDVVPAFADAPLVPVTMIYLVMLSIVIGSLASAEERHIGVLQWQMLMPLAGWLQWTVKVAMALGLALLMGVGVPMLLNYVSPAPDHFDAWRVWQQNAITVTVLTSFSLYVSSLSTGGLRAMLLAFPVGLAGLGLVQWILSTVFIGATAILPETSGRVVLSYRPERELTAIVFATILVALALWLALQNHRSADLGLRRIAVQLLGFLAVPLLAVLVFAGTVVVRMFIEG